MIKKEWVNETYSFYFYKFILSNRYYNNEKMKEMYLCLQYIISKIHNKGG